MIADFSGMLPLRDPLLLPDVNSQNAVNTWMYKGSLRGWRHNDSVYNMVQTDTQQVYRIPKSFSIADVTDYLTSTWLELPDPYMAAIRNPTVGDTYNRYYFFPSDQYNQSVNPMWPAASPGPVYNPLSQIIAGAPWLTLGIPNPATAPTVTPPGGTPSEGRAYLYTYVSAYEEEGPPSPPTVADGLTTGTWTIVIPGILSSVTTGRAIVTMRLYRTVTDSSGNATYYQVTEVPVSTSPVTINDSALDASITGNSPLSSVSYTPPPAGLQGVVMMANGIAAGFTNTREVWFSAAYLPHAWPASYAITVDYPIVGLTPNGSSLNIITSGQPFIATGTTPDTITVGKVVANEPCIARGSIVASGEGAYYVSVNGVQLLNTGGTENMTAGVYEREFLNTLQPQNWAAGKYAMIYVAFMKGQQPSFPTVVNGSAIDRSEPNTEFMYMSTNHSVLNVYNDELSGQSFVVYSDPPGTSGYVGTVRQWNPPNSVGAGSLRPYLWRSKIFRFTSPQLFKAFLVYFDIPPEVDITLGVRNTAQPQTFDQNTQYMIVNVYADGNFIVVREVQVSGEVLLIPGGYKAKFWEFEIIGQVETLFLKAASSVKELRSA
jgi:hypothetical protein